METVPLSAVIDAAAQFYGLSNDAVMGKSHRSGVVKVRHLVWWIARSRMGLSYPKIGKVFATDHSTVVKGLKTLEGKIKRDPELAQDAEKIFAGAALLAALRATGRPTRASDVIACEKPVLVLVKPSALAPDPRRKSEKPLSRIRPGNCEIGTREWFKVNNERFVKGALAALRAGNGGNDGHA